MPVSMDIGQRGNRRNEAKRKGFLRNTCKNNLNIRFYFIIYRISQKTWLNNKHTLIWTWNLKIPKSHQTLFYNVISEALVFYNQGKVYILFAQCSNLLYSLYGLKILFYCVYSSTCLQAPTVNTGNKKICSWTLQMNISGTG